MSTESVWDTGEGKVCRRWKLSGVVNLEKVTEKVSRASQKLLAVVLVFDTSLISSQAFTFGFA